MQVVIGEQAYAGISTTLTVINKDIHWPQCISIKPYTLSLIGGNITLYGMFVEMFLIADVCGRADDVLAHDLLPGVQVMIDGQQPCEHIQLISREQLQCELGPLVFVGRYLSQQVTGVYLNVSVSNPDGGFEMMNEPIFATNDCPVEGTLYSYAHSVQQC